MSRSWDTYEWGGRTVATGVTIEWEHRGGGYEWNCWALVSKQSGDQKLWAAYMDGGCSCNMEFEFSPDEYDLSWTPNLKEAASALSRDIRDSNYYGDEDWTPDRRAIVLAELSQIVMKLR